MTATATVNLRREVEGVGLIEYVETEKARSYWLTPPGGQRRQRMPSVTTVLEVWPKGHLLRWYRNLGASADAILERSQDRGHAVHAYVENFLSSGELVPLSEYPEDFRPFIQAAASWLFEYDPEPLPEGIERLLCHPEMRYAGRADLYALIRGRRTIVDFKTNDRGAVYASHHVQVGGYAIAEERCSGEPVEDTMIVGLSASGQAHPVTGKDASRVWASALDFYTAVRKFEREAIA